MDGAKVVIVNLHCGDQNVARPSSFQLTLAATLTRSPDITAIAGQHVHIVQTIRILNGKLVVLGRRGTCGCTTQPPRTANRWQRRSTRSAARFGPRIACQPGDPLVLRYESATRSFR